MFDLVLDRGRRKCLAAESKDELQDWTSLINEVRSGKHRLSIKGSRTSGMSATSNEFDDTVFDDNSIYEAAGSKFQMVFNHDNVGGTIF